MLWILRMHTMHTTIFEDYSLLYMFNLAYESAIHEYRYYQNSVQFSNIDIVQVVHSLDCSQLTLKLSDAKVGLKNRFSGVQVSTLLCLCLNINP